MSSSSNSSAALSTASSATTFNDTHVCGEVTGGMFVPGVLDPIDSNVEDPVEPSNPQCPYAHLSNAICEMTEKAWEDSSPGFPAERPFKTATFTLLSSIPPDVLRCVINGTLPRVVANHSLPAVTKFISLTNEEMRISPLRIDGKLVCQQPTLRAHYLVDNNSFEPSRDQLADIASIVRFCSISPEMMERVGLGPVVDREDAQQFFDAVMARHHSDKDVRPLSAFVYCPNPKESPRSALVQLVDRICERIFPQFYIHEYVVALCFTPDQARYGELALNIIGQGMVAGGAGLHYYTSASTKEAGNIAAHHWAKWSSNAMHFTPAMAIINRKIENLKNLLSKSAGRRYVDTYNCEYDISELEHIQRTMLDMTNVEDDASTGTFVPHSSDLADPLVFVPTTPVEAPWSPVEDDGL
ncbi:hypothetical protein HDK77DRAFT_74270 [Phyllosticta capitalensis]